MATPKLDIEKFIRENDCHLWRFKMRALLVHQGMNEALGEASSSKKVRKVSYENISNVMDIGYGVMILSLRNGVLIEVGNEMIAVGL